MYTHTHRCVYTCIYTDGKIVTYKHTCLENIPRRFILSLHMRPTGQISDDILAEWVPGESAIFRDQPINKRPMPNSGSASKSDRIRHQPGLLVAPSRFYFSLPTDLFRRTWTPGLGSKFCRERPERPG